MLNKFKKDKTEPSLHVSKFNVSRFDAENVKSSKRNAFNGNF